MDEYISKPIRAIDLYELIESKTGHRFTRTQTNLAQPAPPEPIVDWSRAFDTVGGDRILLEELVFVFLSDRDTLVSNISNAIKDGNANELRLSAHSIKGALTHLGAREPAMLASMLEEIGSTGDLKTKSDVKSDVVTEVLQKLKDRLAPLAAEMNDFITRT